MGLFVTIVLDGVGIGEQPDASIYGDEGSHTLRHVCEVARPHLPHLERLGLGCIVPLAGLGAMQDPTASYGKMLEVSAGKDSTTGHWELAGIVLDRPFPTFPGGFPKPLIEMFKDITGMEAVLGNRADSGTAIIDALGERHQQTRWPIVYTSADSVFQVAAHKDTIPLIELYEICRLTREICTGDYGVGRVIARPFIGHPGAYKRVSEERKDYSLLPPTEPLQAMLQQAGIATISIGKVYDLFGGVGFDQSYKTKSNAEGVKQLLASIRTYCNDPTPTYIWANLVDFDQEFGHRNDPVGFGAALEAFDRSVPDLLGALPEDAVLLVTADHGNDPTTPGTDHSREYVPVLKYQRGVAGHSIGTRGTFADHAATVATYFDLSMPAGSAF